MARAPKDATGETFQEDPPRVLKNTEARKQTIKKAAAEMERIDAQIKELREEKNAIKNEKIKGELGMKISDFNLALRIYRLEDENRSEALDTFRECMEALAPNEQMDWIKATGQDRAAVGTPGLGAPTH